MTDEQKIVRLREQLASAVGVLCAVEAVLSAGAPATIDLVALGLVARGCLTALNETATTPDAER